MAQFQFIIDGDLVEFDRWEDVPELFDHVIKFIPDIIEPPHSVEDHEELAKWNDRLQELMEKERARSN